MPIKKKNKNNTQKTSISTFLIYFFFMKNKETDKVFEFFHAATFYVFCALYLNAILLIIFSETLV